MTEPNRTEDINKIVLDTGDVGSSLLPLLKPFEGLDGDLYGDIARALFHAYRKGTKATVEDVLQAGRAVTG